MSSRPRPRPSCPPSRSTARAMSAALHRGSEVCRPDHSRPAATVPDGRRPGLLGQVPRHRLDGAGGRTHRGRGGDLGHQVPSGQGAVVERQPGQVRLHPLHVDARRVPWLEPRPHHAGQIAEIDAEVARPLLPLGHQRGNGAAAILVRPGGVVGPVRSGRRRRGPALSHPVFAHGRRALGEQPAQRGIDPDHVAEAGAGHVPGGAEALTQFEPEASVIDALRRMEMGEEPPAVHRRPPPVHALGHVGRDQVGVQVRIEGAAGAVQELPGHRTRSTAAGPPHRGGSGAPPPPPGRGTRRLPPPRPDARGPLRWRSPSGPAGAARSPTSGRRR